MRTLRKIKIRRRRGRRRRNDPSTWKEAPGNGEFKRTGWDVPGTVLQYVLVGGVLRFNQRRIYLQRMRGWGLSLRGTLTSAVSSALQ